MVLLAIVRLLVLSMTVDRFVNHSVLLLVRHHAVHGLVFAITAGTGIRFIYGVFSMSCDGVSGSFIGDLMMRLLVHNMSRLFMSYVTIVRLFHLLFIVVMRRVVLYLMMLVNRMFNGIIAEDMALVIATSVMGVNTIDVVMQVRILFDMMRSRGVHMANGMLLMVLLMVLRAFVLRVVVLIPRLFVNNVTRFFMDVAVRLFINNMTIMMRFFVFNTAHFMTRLFVDYVSSFLMNDVSRLLVDHMMRLLVNNVARFFIYYMTRRFMNYISWFFMHSMPVAIVFSLNILNVVTLWLLAMVKHGFDDFLDMGRLMMLLSNMVWSDSVAAMTSLFSMDFNPVIRALGQNLLQRRDFHAVLTSKEVSVVLWFDHTRLELMLLRVQVQMRLLFISAVAVVLLFSIDEEFIVTVGTDQILDRMVNIVRAFVRQTMFHTELLNLFLMLCRLCLGLWVLELFVLVGNQLMKSSFFFLEDLLILDNGFVHTITLLLMAKAMIGMWLFGMMLPTVVLLAVFSVMLLFSRGCRR